MVALGAALFVAACSAPDDDPTLQGDVPSTSASSSTTTRPTTTTTARPACPAVEPRPVEPGLAEHEADVDGDGRPDLAQSFPDDEGRVTLLVDLTAGGGATAQVLHDPEFPAALLGAAPFDQRLDDREILWLRVGAGASTLILGAYWFDDCTLGPVRFADGDPVELAIGGSVGSIAGAECGSISDPAAALIVREGRLDGNQYEITQREYRYRAGVLTPSPDAAVTTRVADASSTARFRCGDLEL